jgi:hypothetical protein
MSSFLTDVGRFCQPALSLYPPEVKYASIAAGIIYEWESIEI